MISSKEVSEAILIAETCTQEEVRVLLKVLLENNAGSFKDVGLADRTKASMARFLRGKDFEKVRDLLISVLMTHERSCSKSVKPVFTAPKKYRPSQRTTKDEVIDLVSSAQSSIYIFGFWLTEGVRLIVEQLCEASDRGVKIIIFADSMDNFIQPLRTRWTSKTYPSMYLLKKQATHLNDTKMHAKTIVVDEKRILITSANMTYLGMNENLEMGVVIEDHAATTKICEFISQVIHDSDFFEKVK